MYKYHNKLILSITALVITGCASNQTPSLNQYKDEFSKNPPTTEWLENNIDSFREKAWSEPTKDNVESFAYIKNLLDRRNSKIEDQANWQRQTHRLLTVDWLDETRGGAAYRKPAYEHVLTDGQVELLVRKAKPILASDTTLLTSGSMEKLKPGPYSTYELSSWEKFCNSGQGMTKADWDFVLKAGIQNVPAALIGDCIPPK